MVDPAHPVGELVQAEAPDGGVPLQLTDDALAILIGGSDARVCHGAQITERNGGW